MDIARLERTLGYNFGKPELLLRAMTHSSWAHEHFAGVGEAEMRENENESFEFVGDSVLGLAVAEQLYLQNPQSSEGDLTLMKHHLVSMVTLAELASGLNFGEFIRIGRGEEKSGGRAKSALLANTLEAVIAAIFFDGGYDSARDFISRIFEEKFLAATPQKSLDYKTLLQETLQGEKMAAPDYSLLRTEGPPHQRTFFVEAIWETGRTYGFGNSIKSAEMMAANKALAELAKLGIGNGNIEG